MKVCVKIELDCETGELVYKVEVSHEYWYTDVFEISFEKVKDIEKMEKVLSGKELQTKIEEILGIVEIGGKRNIFLD